MFHFDIPQHQNSRFPTSHQRFGVKVWNLQIRNCPVIPWFCCASSEAVYEMMVRVKKPNVGQRKAKQ
jgi:hypothetical protein